MRACAKRASRLWEQPPDKQPSAADHGQPHAGTIRCGVFGKGFPLSETGWTSHSYSECRRDSRFVATELRKRSADVTVVEAYRNVVPPEAPSQAESVFRKPYPDWVIFTSSSSVENLVRITGIEPLRNVKIATIGPITSETVRKYQLTIASEADPHSVTGLLAALRNVPRPTADAL